MTARRSLLIALPALALSVPSPGLSQAVGRDGFRTDVPGVYTPPRPREPVLSPFERAYRRAGRPRLVLFMDRDLSDENRSGVIVRDREEVSSSARVDGRSERREEGGSRNSSLSAEATAREEVTSERVIVRPRVADRERATGEAESWMVEAAFTRRMAAPGIRMVDRAAAMRVAGRSGILDRQALETEAMRSLAEGVVVVRHAALPGGQLLWRATVTSTRDGSRWADVTLAESEVEGDRSKVGEALADRLVEALVAAWNRG